MNFISEFFGWGRDCNGPPVLIRVCCRVISTVFVVRLGDIAKLHTYILLGCRVVHIRRKLAFDVSPNFARSNFMGGEFFVAKEIWWKSSNFTGVARKVNCPFGEGIVVLHRLEPEAIILIAKGKELIIPCVNLIADLLGRSWHFNCTVSCRAGRRTVICTLLCVALRNIAKINANRLLLRKEVHICG